MQFRVFVQEAEKSFLGKILKLRLVVLRDRARNPSDVPNHNWLKFLLRKNKGLNIQVSTNLFSELLQIILTTTVLKTLQIKLYIFVHALEDKLNHQFNTQAELTVSNCLAKVITAKISKEKEPYKFRIS